MAASGTFDPSFLRFLSTIWLACCIQKGRWGISSLRFHQIGFCSDDHEIWISPEKRWWRTSVHKMWTCVYCFIEMKNSDELWKFLLRKNNQCSLPKSSFRVLPEVQIRFLRVQTSFYTNNILQISSSDVSGARYTKFTPEHRTLWFKTISSSTLTTYLHTFVVNQPEWASPLPLFEWTIKGPSSHVTV